jgi:hypothetical protein
MSANLTRRWAEALQPRIATITTTPAVVRAMKAALRAVDRDIQLHGAVSCETVEACRAALALAKT